MRLKRTSSNNFSTSSNSRPMNNNNPLARRQTTETQTLHLRPTAGHLSRSNNQAQPVVIHIHQVPTEPLQEELRTSTYQTGKSRGESPQNLPQLPRLSALSIWVSLITVVLFVVGASMFSIALTNYSNSQTDQSDFVILESD